MFLGLINSKNGTKKYVWFHMHEGHTYDDFTIFCIKIKFKLKVVGIFLFYDLQHPSLYFQFLKFFLTYLEMHK